MLVKRRQTLGVTDRASYLDSKGAFYNGNESDNDDESYHESNEQKQLPEGFSNSCYKIVPPFSIS